MTSHANQTYQELPLSKTVEYHVNQYIEALDGEMPTGLYNLIINEVEKPLINIVMERTNGNISKSAIILGLNRGTLRKKILEHKIK